MLTRDITRASFKDAGLSYEILTPENMRDLRRLIDQKMRKSGLIKSTFRMRRTKKPRNVAGQIFAELRCKAFYFDDREAVTFNPDGFIGFAGWADDVNVQPILQGFIAWVQSRGISNG